MPIQGRLPLHYLIILNEIEQVTYAGKVGNTGQYGSLHMKRGGNWSQFYKYLM
jgi:hypothetical protein